MKKRLLIILMTFVLDSMTHSISAVELPFVPIETKKETEITTHTVNEKTEKEIELATQEVNKKIEKETEVVTQTVNKKNEKETEVITKNGIVTKENISEQNIDSDYIDIFDEVLESVTNENTTIISENQNKQQISSENNNLYEKNYISVAIISILVVIGVAMGVIVVKRKNK